MYLDYFGLEKEPFTISPDPSFLYPSPLHRQALAHLKYGLEREGGFILLTGEVGTGKTTLTRLLLQQLPGNIRVAYILNARLGEQDLMSSICQELGISADPYKTTVREYTDLLNKDLLAAHARGKKTLLVIEEAQNLDPEVLEMLRLLTNLETNTTKLLHILLVAQPELLEVLARPELRQLNQRVVSRYHLEPLSLAETSNYLRHRMRRAGCTRPVFDKTSTLELHRISGGIPRMINLLSERSLLGAYSTNSVGVTKAIVKSAAREVFGEKSNKVSKERSPYLGLSLIAMFLVGLTVLGVWQFYFNEAPARDYVEADTLLSDTSEVTMAEAFPETPITEPEPEQWANAYTQLLERWEIDRVALREDELCSIAFEAGLVCFTERDLTLDKLASMPRQGLVRLQESDDQVALYLLSRIVEDEVILTNASGEIGFTEEQFSRNWDGYFQYLWRPPLGYQDALTVGMKNPEVVDWVQQRILLWDSSYEQVITGGIYSSAISDQVRRFQIDQGLEADGVLGRATVISMNDLVEGSPTLHAEI